VQTVSFGSDWKQVSCGYKFTVAAKLMELYGLGAEMVVAYWEMEQLSLNHLQFKLPHTEIIGERLSIVKAIFALFI
jgi:hypothetical protein